MVSYSRTKIERIESSIINKEGERPSRPMSIIKLSILMVLTILVISNKSFLDFDKEGNVKLADWRKDKLTKELKELDDAEQYVLRAIRNGNFECFSCSGNGSIFLLSGQVYKYGITTKGEKGRYANSLKDKNLLYRIQYTGTIEECLKQEKIKIYNYALLPENLARTFPLIRPPGNKQDN